MASLVEKYEQILTADPRSRIFVELAKALVDRGDLTRAVEVCQRGLEHHPSSIVGRVTWGRALLEGGDAKGAMDQFEIAIALEPSSPYAYNLVGEVLLKKGLDRDALPVLAKAAELQPGDARVKSWLDEAKKRVRGDPSAAPSPHPAGDPKPAGGPAKRRKRAEPGAGPAAAAASAATSTPAPAPTETAKPTASPTAPAATEAASSTAGPAGPAAPPPLPPRKPPAAKKKGDPRSLLHMIPGETREMAALGQKPRTRAFAPTPAAAPPEDAAAADRIAAQYERELREKLMAVPEPPPSFVHRHRRAIIAGSVAVAVGAAAGVYLLVDARNARVQAAGAAARGRAGLARDTLGSLREAHRLLTEGRRLRPGDADIASLAAQVAAVLAADYGEEGTREVASKLAANPAAGDGAIAARWLLAKKPADRRRAEADVLAVRPSSAPLLQALAGRILVARGEVEGGRGRLEIAARANPPLLRALSDLGDASLAAGDPDGALQLYGAALAAHPTHARAALGAAEARLKLGRDLAQAKKDLEAVDADPGSVPPADVRVRFEIVFARVLAAGGAPGAGAARLAGASAALGETGEIAAAAAELYLAARAWDKAEAAAARAVQRDPREPSHKVLLARARIGRGRYAEALAATDGEDGRAARIQRAIARYRLGQWGQARMELAKTARDGKMPAEAAVWFALTDVAIGKADKARPLLEKLAAAPTPPPLAHVALGRAHETQGNRAEAETAYRAAVEREPDAPEGHFALGRLLLASGRAADAIAPLERAVKIDGSDLPARRALAEARLATGHSAAARADLDAVLLATPRDASVLRLLSAAWLAEHQPKEARRAADQAVQFAPRDPAVLVAAARAALATGDAPAAKKLAERALKAGAGGAEADDARRIAGGGAKLAP